MSARTNSERRRADTHRPSAIQPEDYEYVGPELIKIEGLEDCMALQEMRARIQAHMKRTGGTYSSHQHGGNCMVCGSVHAIYTVLFYHAKTNSYVRMGHECAEKCDMGDASEFNAFHKGIKDARNLQKGKNKAKALLSDRGLEQAWAIYEAGTTPTTPREESTVWELVGKLVRYGDISDNQFKYLGVLLERINTRAERKAQREAERAAAKPCPSGRIQIVGTVLNTKYQESMFGETLKMLVKAEDGWLVYGTVPSSLEIFDDGDLQRGLQHGDRIRFKATVTPSENDEKFGFFKRPTGAELIQPVSFGTDSRNA